MMKIEPLLNDVRCDKCLGSMVPFSGEGEAKFFCPQCNSKEKTMSNDRPAPLEADIRLACSNLADFLVEKNRAYGNSAAEPIGIFARHLDALSQIDVRIDDKLNRLKKGGEYPGDDTIKDLVGYLILRMIVVERDKA